MSKKKANRPIKDSYVADKAERTGGNTHWWRRISKSNRFLMIGVVAFLSAGAFGAGLKYLDDSAKTEGKLAAKDRSFISSINPFVPDPTPIPTPNLSKEYIYAGSRLLAVEDTNATAVPPADLAIWRPTTGVWWVFDPSTGWASVTQGWGEATDTPVPGDYDGDGKTDFAVIRPPAQQGGEYWGWYVINSSNGSWSISEYSIAGDLHAPADYDGDGKTDKAVYRPSNQTWYIQGTSAGFYTAAWSSIGTGIPASADYDGDGKADLALWRSGDSSFYSVNSSNGAANTISMGQSGEPVSADYDGDGKADYALYNDGTAYWHVRQSSTSSISSLQWGDVGEFEKPVHNDYDGDGKVDIAVWRNSNGYWYIRQSASANSLRQVGWGQAADIPVPAFYRR